jgi:hypothetical protein
MSASAGEAVAVGAASETGVGKGHLGLKTVSEVLSDKKALVSLLAAVLAIPLLVRAALALYTAGAAVLANRS